MAPHVAFPLLKQTVQNVSGLATSGRTYRRDSEMSPLLSTVCTQALAYKCQCGSKLFKSIRELDTNQVFFKIETFFIRSQSMSVKAKIS